MIRESDLDSSLNDPESFFEVGITANQNCALRRCSAHAINDSTTLLEYVHTRPSTRSAILIGHRARHGYSSTLLECQSEPISNARKLTVRPPPLDEYGTRVVLVCADMCRELQLNGYSAGEVFHHMHIECNQLDVF